MAAQLCEYTEDTLQISKLYVELIKTVLLFFLNMSILHLQCSDEEPKPENCAVDCLGPTAGRSLEAPPGPGVGPPLLQCPPCTPQDSCPVSQDDALAADKSPRAGSALARLSARRPASCTGQLPWAGATHPHHGPLFQGVSQHGGQKGALRPAGRPRG